MRLAFVTCLLTINLLNCLVTNANHIAAKNRLIRDATDQTLDQIQVDTECARRSQCEFRQEVNKRPDTSSSCFCDDKCQFYDDCCSNYKSSQSRDQEAAKQERKFKCHRISEDFGDIQIVARCPVGWHFEALDMTPQLVHIIERRCHQGFNEQNVELSLVDIQSDPMGMMMPITDMLTGITYSNSYCLRCNREEQRRLDRHNNIETKKPKLTAWSPLLECNYNAESDDRNTLFDLISNNMGNALEFSPKLDKWVINSKLMASQDSDSPTTTTLASASKEPETERICSIIPTAPEAITPNLRFCNADTINTCSKDKHHSETTIRECESGTRSLVFSKTRYDRVYRNFACAICNGETAASVDCRAPTRATKREHQLPPEVQSGNSNLTAVIEITSASKLPPAQSSQGRSGAAPISASFAIIFDISGGNEGRGGTVGAIQCPGVHQVYDPFFMTCRCLMCGINKVYREGRCIDNAPSSDSLKETKTDSLGAPKATRDTSNRSPSANLGDDSQGLGKRIEKLSRADSEFEKILNNLDLSNLPEPTQQSREAYNSCGKFIVQSEHYRLFTLSDKFLETADSSNSSSSPNSSINVDIKSSVILLSQQELVSGGFDKKRIWAYVKPYKLILASSQFEPVRGFETSKEDLENQMDLFICSPFTEHWSRKFSLEMAYVTSICLTISIVSLTLFLIAHFISMMDLSQLAFATERLVKSMNKLDIDTSAEFGAATKRADSTDFAINQQTPFRIRSSSDTNRSVNSTNFNNNNSTSNRSRSLSSRGVACLSASLLAAYLLFILSYKPVSDKYDPLIGSEWDCKIMAICTNYCFLVAFTWMFLMSYDIWRTLRRACYLLGPAKHSQSRRFIGYAIFSLVLPAIVVGFSIIMDQVPIICENQDLVPEEFRCSSVELGIDKFVKSYRPRYGRIKAAGVCWFMSRNSLALFFGLPISMIVAINLIWFLHCSWMVIQTTRSSSRVTKHRVKDGPKMVSVITRTDSSDSYPGSRFLTRQQTQDSAISSKPVRTESRRSTNSNIGSVISCTISSSSDEDMSHNEPAQAENGQQVPQAPQVRRKSRVSNASCSSTDLAAINKSVIQNQRKLSNSSSVSEVAFRNVPTKTETHLEPVRAVMSRIIRDYRLYCRLSTMMGLTWLVGLMASWVDKSPILWHLFIILNALQGFFIFVAFGLQRNKLDNLAILFNYCRVRILIMVKTIIDRIFT